MALPQPKITYKSTARADSTEASNQPYFNESVTPINNNPSLVYTKPSIVIKTPLPSAQTAASNHPVYNTATKAVNDNDFNKQKQIRNVSIIRGRSNPKSKAESIVGQNIKQTVSPRTLVKSVKSLIKNNPALLLARIGKVTTVSLSIVSWSMVLWFFVQLPFAILGLIMLGLMGVMDSIAGAFAKDNKVSGDIGSWLFYKATAVAGWVAEKALAGVQAVTGIDVNIASMADGLFYIFLVVVFAIGFLTLLSASIIYIMTNHRPFSGEGAGLKIGLFIMAMIGYMTPIFNLFPWHLPWLAAVWKYPK